MVLGLLNPPQLLLQLMMMIFTIEGRIKIVFSAFPPIIDLTGKSGVKLENIRRTRKRKVFFFAERSTHRM
jgi:hypothetical protein